MIRFRLAGIPVGVHVSFGIVALMGLGLYRGVELVAWTVAVFLAVLVHELGHAFTARAFGGRRIEVTLFALGGVTTWRPGVPMSPWRAFVVAAAGSAVGIAAGGLVWLAFRLGLAGGVPHLGVVFAQSFVWAALGWGLLNWIPILPLDGGRMLEHLVAAVAPGRAHGVARVVSIVVGTVLVVVLWRAGSRFFAFFVATLTLVGARREGTERPRRSPPAVEEGGGEFPI
ncbi:MAG TPA: hypothetical protein ENK55_12360 [Actinobacteria bacterium]|nr:hypothetical protein [Actinomycetota bacterium]